MYVLCMSFDVCESNRAKPPDGGRFVPEGERAQIKIPGLGQTILARAAHLLAQTGYFYSAWFSLGNGSSPKTCEVRAL
jgi:hypothetical protein